MIDTWYLENLVCPRDQGALSLEHDALRCAVCSGTYPVVDGMPVMLREDKEQTVEVVVNSIKRSRGELIDARAPELYLESMGGGEDQRALAVSLIGKSKIDPVVSVIICFTSGYLYKHMVGKLDSYPIPELRLEPGNGKKLLDIGCNWGRWSIAAHRKGYQVVGVDPGLGGIMAARRVSRSMGYDIKFVCADARFLPFRQGGFDTVFSYSVLQHLSKEDALSCVREVSRMLKPQGYCFIQMANKFGIRSLQHQLKRGFRPAKDFEVRYWSPAEISTVFGTHIGKATLTVDGFLGLGIQKTDLKLMPLRYKGVIMVSEMLRGISRVIPPLVCAADSIYVKAVKTSS